MNRIIRPRMIRAPIDDITDPIVLGHALTGLGSHSEKFKYSKYVRVSSFHDVCIRERVLGWRHNLLLTERTSISDHMLYDKGNAYHEWLQNDPKYFGDRRIGWWRCLACKEKRFGRPPTKKCKHCGAHPEAIKYEEHEMKIVDPFYVSGHPDMMLEVQINDIRVAEIKSMKSEQFEKLRTPLAANVMQLVGYMTYMPFDKSLPIRVNSESGLLVYVSKKEMSESYPLKAFHIHRQPAMVRTMAVELAFHKKGVEDDQFVPDLYSTCLQTEWKTWKARKCPCLELCVAATMN